MNKEAKAMYESLFEYWKQERVSEKLLSLRETFLQRLRTYIEQLINEMRSEDMSELQRLLLEAELSNLRFILKSLLQHRVRKILAMVLASETIDHSLLTRQEQRFVEQITRSLRSVMMLEEDLFAPMESDSSASLTLVRFLEDYPEIAGVDLKTYGPFRADDLAVLPLENARGIIRRNGAEPVDIGADQSESAQGS
jgi:DNA replication factor GINS